MKKNPFVISILAHTCARERQNTHTHTRMPGRPLEECVALSRGCFVPTSENTHDMILKGYNWFPSELFLNKDKTPLLRHVTRRARLRISLASPSSESKDENFLIKEELRVFYFILIQRQVRGGED